MDICEDHSSLTKIAQVFDIRLRVARAAELALAGKLLQAESLLSPNGCLPSNSHELDMLARIHVRQGRLIDALKRWREASRLTNKRSFQAEIASLLNYADLTIQRKTRTLLAITLIWGTAVFSLLAFWVKIR